MTERVCVAAIAGAYGVRGEVRLKSFCAEPEAVATYGPLETEDGNRRFDISLKGPIKNGFAARLTGVGTKEAANRLRGERLYAPRDVLPDLPDDEYYHTDLIGLSVLDTGGVELGQVKAVLNHGSSDLLEVAGKRLKQPVLLPFTQAAVPTVDIAAGRIVADPPEGLFE